MKIGKPFTVSLLDILWLKLIRYFMVEVIFTTFTCI